MRQILLNVAIARSAIARCFSSAYEQDFARHARQGHCVAVPMIGGLPSHDDEDLVMGSPVQSIEEDIWRG